jgi:hypothetical protein
MNGGESEDSGRHEQRVTPRGTPVQFHPHKPRISAYDILPVVKARIVAVCLSSPSSSAIIIGVTWTPKSRSACASPSARRPSAAVAGLASWWLGGLAGSGATLALHTLALVSVRVSLRRSVSSCAVTSPGFSEEVTAEDDIKRGGGARELSYRVGPPARNAVHKKRASVFCQ